MLHANHECITTRRRFAVVFSLVGITLVGTPIVQNFRKKPDDGFPLSYYPMFSEPRDGTTQLTHAIGVRADGSTVDLHYRLVGRGGMNQIRRQIRKMVKNDDAKKLCRDVAERVSESSRAECRDLTAVAIVTDVYNYHDYFRGIHDPASRKEVTRCAVRRASHQDGERRP